MLVLVRSYWSLDASNMIIFGFGCRLFDGLFCLGICWNTLQDSSPDYYLMCHIWTYITGVSIQTLINVSQLPIKGWVSYSRISNHSINLIKLTNLYHWFIFDCRNYNLIWAVPFMLFAFFKAEVQIQLAEEMMKETREEPKIPPTMEKV